MPRSLSLSTRLTSGLGPALASALALALLAPACGTSDVAAPAPAAPRTAQTASDADAKAACVQIFSRSRTCTDQYIPALVDLRARYDRPAGVAAAVAADRAGVIAQAMSEWATDSQPAAIDAACAQIVAGLTDEERADVEGAPACLQSADCAAYTACIMPYFEKRFAK